MSSFFDSMDWWRERENGSEEFLCLSVLTKVFIFLLCFLKRVCLSYYKKKQTICYFFKKTS